MGRNVTVRGPFRGPSGHDHHVREFVRALDAQGVTVQLVDVPEWSAAALPADAQDPWFRTLTRPVKSPVSVQFCMPHQVRPLEGTLTVNYTMFEATRIPAAWVAHGRAHDLVVVPTASSRRAWVDGGHAPGRVDLCPLGVDSGRFRPGVEPIDLTDRRGRRVAEYATRVLNVSELGPRKNLLGLLRVWIGATTAADDAVLVIKLGRYAPGWTIRFMRDLDTLEHALGKGRKDAASVLFVDRLFSDAEMPRLFATATHYWSMSHGEGWDQPMVEAGAAGLRLIAPDHSAYAAYLDASVATLVPARPIPARFDGSPALARLFHGASWWEPDEDAAAAALRRALDGDDTPASSLRDRLAAEFTWERAATRLTEVLDALLASRGRGW